MREIEAAKDKNANAHEQIRILKEEIEKERRKSLADQSKIKKLEEMLGEKIKEIQAGESRYMDHMRKTELN